MNPNMCKICASPDLEKIEACLKEGVAYRKIAADFDINLRTLSQHKTNHMDIFRVAPEPPEVDPAELDSMSSPDVVKIVERQVNEYETIKRKRKLEPLEDRERGRFIEFLIKIELARLESKSENTPLLNEAQIEELKKKNGIIE